MENQWGKDCYRTCNWLSEQWDQSQQCTRNGPESDQSAIFCKNMQGSVSRKEKTLFFSFVFFGKLPVKGKNIKNNFCFWGFFVFFSQQTKKKNWNLWKRWKKERSKMTSCHLFEISIFPPKREKKQNLTWKTQNSKNLVRVCSLNNYFSFQLFGGKTTKT